MSKLYLVTRADLRYGSQAAQLVHGMASFARDHYAKFVEWERTSNTVVCLAVSNETALHSFLERVNQINATKNGNYAISTFREPDFDDTLTCVVLEPDETLTRICGGIPLACR
jgi:peptidyl-tRNA hydrolase